VQSNFGIEEVLDPGLCVECPEGRFHVNEDHFLAEVCDGELVITTLCREAMPLLRYRTRIACEMKSDKCACGRTGATITPGGRLDGRLRVKETPFYEEQIAQVLAQTRAAGHKFWTRVSENTVVISVQLTSELFSDMMWPLGELQRQIESEFLARLGIPTEVRFVQSAP
jgi:phenylacetate-CoA ligase